MSQRLSFSSIVAVLLLAARAHGQPFLVSIRYQAPAECRSEAWFLQQVLRRARHARLAVGSESAREFRVVITQSANESRARLDFVDVESKHVQRDLEGSNCAEVVAGIALITALAIDPLLADPTQEHAASASSDRAQQFPPQAVAKPPLTLPVSPANASSNTAGAPIGEPRRSSLLLGVSLGTASYIAPVWAPSITLYSEFVSPNHGAALRLRISYSDSGEVTRNAANMRFWLAAGMTEGCPWAAQLTTGLRIWPCAGAQIGILHAQGLQSERLPFPNSTHSLWLAGDIALRTQIELSRTLVFEIEGQGLATVLRHSYVYERPLTIGYRTPALGTAVYAAMGVRLGR